jgi:hypothetical protein
MTWAYLLVLRGAGVQDTSHLRRRRESAWVLAFAATDAASVSRDLESSRTIAKEREAAHRAAARSASASIASGSTSRLATSPAVGSARCRRAGSVAVTREAARVGAPQDRAGMRLAQGACVPDRQSAQATDAPVATPEDQVRWRRLALRLGLAIVAVAVLVLGVRYWTWSLHHESTDDAFIDVHVVNVAPRVAGRVQRVLVGDNQPVEAGDLLIELDPRDFQVKLDDAAAARSAASGRLTAAHAQVDVAVATRAQA